MYTVEEIKALEEKWTKEKALIDDYWHIEGVETRKDETDGIANSRLNYERRRFKDRILYLDYPETDDKLLLEETRYAIYADCMTIKVPHMPIKINYVGNTDIEETEDESKGGGVRGVCKGFSRASRLRMKKRLSKLKLEGKYCFFITLSYPGVYVDDIQVSKRDLQVFKKAFYRAFPDFVGGFWRLELQKRGAPHFHMLLISDRPVSQKKLVAFLREKWPNIVRTSYLKNGGDETKYRIHYERHKNSGHNVQFMKSREMVCNYEGR
jgi:hypothetical protein